MAQVRDFNPARCTYTWTPEIDGRFCPEVRCTKRADDAGHDHQWDAFEQEEWTAITKALLLQEMGV